MTDFTEGTKWPGVNITQTKTIDNMNWYYKEFTITQKGGLINFVFCEPDAAGTAAKTQSQDFTGVNSTILSKWVLTRIVKVSISLRMSLKT